MSDYDILTRHNILTDLNLNPLKYQTIESCFIIMNMHSKYVNNSSRYIMAHLNVLIEKHMEHYSNDNCFKNKIKLLQKILSNQITLKSLLVFTFVYS